MNQPRICVVLTMAFATVASARAETNASPLVVFEAACKVLQENYPMLEYSGWTREWMDEFRTRINSATNAEEGFWLIDELVCRLTTILLRHSLPLGTAPLC